MRELSAEYVPVNQQITPTYAKGGCGRFATVREIVTTLFWRDAEVELGIGNTRVVRNRRNKLLARHDVVLITRDGGGRLNALNEAIVVESLNLFNAVSGLWVARCVRLAQG